MNETIFLSQRQKAIINLLSQKDLMSREMISTEIKSKYPVSKATLARDLKEMLSAKLIKATGNGPQRSYSLRVVHPLLKPVDLDLYFQSELDQRVKETLTPFLKLKP